MYHHRTRCKYAELKSCWWRLIISAGAPPIAHQVQSVTPRNLVGGRLLMKQVFQGAQKKEYESVLWLSCCHQFSFVGWFCCCFWLIVLNLGMARVTELFPLS